ncbi:MAG TPA: hypothetical protein VF601_11235 [Beijerinckiaceae bacterium]
MARRTGVLFVVAFAGGAIANGYFQEIGKQGLELTQRWLKGVGQDYDYFDYSSRRLSDGSATIEWTEPRTPLSDGSATIERYHRPQSR